jgi:hypothetical protein
MSNTTQLINNGGSAFPLHVPGDDFTEYTQQGMTLRDYFAAKCLSGDFVASDEGCYANESTDKVIKERATLYYRFADAMIAARKEAI